MATKRERTEKKQKKTLKGEGEVGGRQSWGERLPPGAEGGMDAPDVSLSPAMLSQFILGVCAAAEDHKNQ